MARKTKPAATDTVTVDQIAEAAGAAAFPEPEFETPDADSIEQGLTDIEDEPELDEEAEGGKPTMSETLRKYRVGYVKAVSYSKGATLDNGDALATALRGLTPKQSCALADVVMQTASGYHAERYASLNVGQQRMNSANRVRALIKKGETDIDTVLAQLAEVLKD